MKCRTFTVSARVVTVGWKPDNVTVDVLTWLARTETPLSVLRGASVPVLALPWGMMREPRCVVIGVDLTETSVVAARRAAPLLHAAERVYLVHVQEPVAPLAELPVVPEYDDTAARNALAEHDRQ